MKTYETFTEEVTFGKVTYVVTGKHRDWNPLPGHTPPEGTLWEVVTKFGEHSIVGAGGTRKEAMYSLCYALGLHIARKGFQLETTNHSGRGGKIIGKSTRLVGPSRWIPKEIPRPDSLI